MRRSKRMCFGTNSICCFLSHFVHFNILFWNLEHFYYSSYIPINEINHKEMPLLQHRNIEIKIVLHPISQRLGLIIFKLSFRCSNLSVEIALLYYRENTLWFYYLSLLEYGSILKLSEKSHLSRKNLFQ